MRRSIPPHARTALPDYVPSSIVTLFALSWTGAVSCRLTALYITFSWPREVHSGCLGEARTCSFEFKAAADFAMLHEAVHMHCTTHATGIEDNNHWNHVHSARVTRASRGGPGRVMPARCSRCLILAPGYTSVNIHTNRITRRLLTSLAKTPQEQSQNSSSTARYETLPNAPPDRRSHGHGRSAPRM